MHEKENQQTHTSDREGGKIYWNFLFFPNAPHEGMQMDDLPPHSTYYSYAHEQENHHAPQLFAWISNLKCCVA